MIRTAAALALLAVGVAAGPAQAQLEGAAVANVAAGATNNPLSVEDGLPKSNDEFTLIRAGVQGRYLGRRNQQTLSYTYAGTFYAQTTAANTNAHDLLWALLASPSARTELQAQVDGTYGRLNSLNPIATLGAMNAQNIAGATFASLPTGPVTYASAMASLSGIYRPTAVKNWSELTTFTAFIPITGPASQSFVVTQSGHFDRSWGRNALTLDVLGSYFDSSATPDNAGGQLPGTKTVDVQGLVGWRHDFSPAAFVAASGGILVLDTPGSGGTLSVEPVASGTAHYQTKVALAELIVSAVAAVERLPGPAAAGRRGHRPAGDPAGQVGASQPGRGRHRPAPVDVRTAGRGRRGPAGRRRGPGVRAADVPAGRRD